MDNLLDVQSLSIIHTPSRHTIVKNIHLSVPYKTCLGLIGESGSGKTMISRAILNLLPHNCSISEGKICFEGQTISSWSPKQQRALLGKDIAVVLQNAMGSLHPGMRIKTQLFEALQLHTRLRDQEMYDRAIHLLQEVRISNPQEVMQCYPFQLSGGTQQRIVIAMALCSHPKLIIADEPTSSLDTISQAAIIRIFKKILETYDTSILLITHNLPVVEELCDQITLIHQGRVVETNRTQSILQQARHPYTKYFIEQLYS